jgi:translocation and assembly module TamB
MRIRPRLLRVALVVLLTPLLAIALVVGAITTEAGQSLLARAIGWGTGGQVHLTGLSLRLAGEIQAERLEIADTNGTWLTVGGLSVHWSPRALLSRELLLEDVTAARVQVTRTPVASAAADPHAAPFQLPVLVILDALRIDRLDLAPAVAGQAVTLAITGSGQVMSLSSGEITVDIARSDSAGHYRLHARRNETELQAQLDVEEPPHGMLATMADLPDIGSLLARVTLAGPLDAVSAQASLSSGPLRASAGGLIDLPGAKGSLDITGSAPAMSPSPDIAWQSVGLEVHVAGPITAPAGKGRLHIAGLAAFGTSVRDVSLEGAAENGRFTAQGMLAGLRAPGTEAFGAAPIQITANGDIAGSAVTFDLLHPLVHAQGTARLAGESDIAVTLPDLEPLATMAGADLGGTAQLGARLRLASGALAWDATGHVGLTRGPAQALALLGPDAPFELTGTQRGGDVSVSRLSLTGHSLTVLGDGGLTGGAIAARVALAVSDLAGLAPTLGGTLRIEAKVAGPLSDMTGDVDVSGSVAVAGAVPTPITSHIAMTGLPSQPSGSVTVGGTLDGAPLTLSADIARAADGTLRFDIGQAAWKSARADARLVWRPDALWPTGQAALHITTVGDLQRLLGTNIAGGIDATATLRDPPAIEATVSAQGFRAGALTTGLRVDAVGPPTAIALRLTATGDAPPGASAIAPVRVTSAGTLDAEALTLDISSLEARMREETLSLAGPARVTFKTGLAVEHVRLRLRDAVIEVSGRVFPVLDMTASLRDLPADIVALLSPDLKLAGSVKGEARLTGSISAPGGTISLTGTGLRLRDGMGATLKPAQFTAVANLSAASVRLDATASAADAKLGVTGTLPLKPGGELDLRVTGHTGLAVLDAVTAAKGRRVRGDIDVDAIVAGPLSAPRTRGRLRLSGGELQDLTLGLRIRQIEAQVTADGDTVQLVHLTGKAGSGSIEASGTLGLVAPMPIALTLTLRNAGLLAADLVTSTLDAALSVTGSIGETIAAGGTITLGRTEIRVPENLPPSVAVLKVRRPGEKRVPPVAPGPSIGLDLTVLAPGALFVRGHGIDAELEGEVHLVGQGDAVRPSGGFTLRRGSFTLVGHALTFTAGQVTLDGRMPIDPMLNFTGTTTATGTSGSIDATVAITGHASKPKITLSSVPERPADEVLAQLLFGRGTSALGPLELAQLAGALAELSGIGPSTSPLDTLRSRLGLDRLTVGSGSKGSGARVEIGRTVVPGVYLGARQKTDGTGTQATVQIDLYKGLKLKADVGSTAGNAPATGAAGDSGTNVGVTYQFEY